MSYIEEIKSVIFDYADDVRKYLSGDKADCVYCAQHSEEWGTSDKNYANRMRLCYALYYDVCEVPDKWALVRELFIEELKDRESNSFQGIGDNLETLTSMLLELGEPPESELFERAKNANFDCACGYEPRVIKPVPLDEFTPYECIYTLSDLRETELVFKLTDEFKSGELDLKGLRELRSIAEYCTKRSSDKEFAVTRIYGIFQRSPELFDNSGAFRAVNDYTEILLEKGDTENALLVFNEHRKPLMWFKRKFYALGARLIAGGADNPEKIWSDILPHIIVDLKNNMVAPINRDIILAAAERAGDRKMMKKLQKYFEKQEMERRKIFG